MASTSYLESVRDDVSAILEKWVNELVESELSEDSVVDLLGSIHAVQEVAQQLVSTELRARRINRRVESLQARKAKASRGEGSQIDERISDLQGQLVHLDDARAELTANLSALAAMLHGGMS